MLTKVYASFVKSQRACGYVLYGGLLAVEGKNLSSTLLAFFFFLKRNCKVLSLFCYILLQTMCLLELLTILNPSSLVSIEYFLMFGFVLFCFYFWLLLLLFFYNFLFKLSMSIMICLPLNLKPKK